MAGWILQFCVAVFVCGTCFSIMHWQGLIAGLVGVAGVFIALSIVEFVCVTFPRDWRE
jgi:hypothetical protein